MKGEYNLLIIEACIDLHHYLRYSIHAKIQTSLAGKLEIYRNERQISSVGAALGIAANHFNFG